MCVCTCVFSWLKGIGLEVMFSVDKETNKLEIFSKINGEWRMHPDGKTKIKIKFQNNLRNPKVCKRNIL